MNSFQLTCFLTVAETLNFARSAERLNITQPAVTHQIKSLESELGVALFNRSTHSVELTKAGLLLLDDARTIVATTQRVKKRYEVIHAQEFPELRIGCHSDGFLLELPEILKSFSAVYPDVHVNIRMASSQAHLYQFLMEDKIDILLSIKEPDNKRKTPGIYKELTKTSTVCICSVDHPFASRTQLTMQELSEANLILYEPTKSTFFDIQIWGKLMNGRDPADLHFCESAVTAIMLAKAGYGIFLMPEIYAPTDPSLTIIPLSGLADISFGMYYKSLKSNAFFESFCEILKKYFKNGGRS